MGRSLSRRSFLKHSSLFAAWAALSACSPRPSPLAPPSPTAAAGEATPALGNALPGPAGTATPPAGLAGEAQIAHALRRLTFGPTPEMAARARSLGLERWLEEQLHPDSLDDSEADEMVRQLNTLRMTPEERLQIDRPAVPVREIILATLIRQRFSQRQVYETLVDFWSNHFNIFIGKSLCKVLKTDDDLGAIRPNALGRFKDLLWASAHSPAMLVYLDQAQSTGDRPNENYARELMELHTIGVDAGYSHHDVAELARALTGWSVVGLRLKGAGLQPGTYLYRANVHDDGEKHILGLHLPAGGGESDGERVLDYLAGHEQAALFISARLARRFVADDPPASLVGKLAGAFQAAEGDTRELMRAMVRSQEFWASAGRKFKRPLEFFISALRVTNARVSDRPRPVGEWLRRLGQVPFSWPPPDGYPDHAAWWQTTSGLLNRWNFALGLTANDIPGTAVDLKALTADASSPADVVDALSLRFIGEPLPPEARDIVVDFAASGDLGRGLAPTAALILGSPHFQMR